ncbi:NAD(+) synthase [Myxococcota bacterium]
MTTFSAEVLQYDIAKETDRICEVLREQVTGQLKRRGAVVGISGGIDSSVVAALCARALGPRRVQGLLMPERDSADETLGLSRAVADCFGIATELEDITDILSALRCYERRDEAIRSVVPEYGPGYKSKIVIPSAVDNASYNIFSVVVESPDGVQTKARLSPKAYLGIVAATNFKQRVRKMLEYYYADKLNFAVAGTPNRLEYDQGFFVKTGDGAADIKPIAHLYKTQVYMMAKHLGVPEKIRKRPPTTDTYTLQQGQDEFFFALPYDKMDLCLYAKNHDIPTKDVAGLVGLTTDQVASVFADIDKKRVTTRYLHASPLLIEKNQDLDLLG